ncbi:hypothetical protein [Micromonospora sp. KC213]|uniref:hypothetical protein n=1 Tax=Micromonospora sp. KC213 TaxID=2530378 RepID=UPI00105304F8|nr:hypothetical protein [Micromonospora sp. KC213]TDC42236.1 hypothetical protein E1166_08655 [Micromonospora sp. KC213]
MRAIRHQLFVLAGLMLLGVVAGLAPAAWVALTLTVCVGVNRSTALFRAARHAQMIIMALTVLSLVLVVGGVGLLFAVHGWKAALGFVVLLMVYFGAAETPHGRAGRRARMLRDDLCDLVRAWTAGSITEDQLATRTESLLRKRLHGYDFQVEIGRETLTSAEGLSPEEHRLLLQVLQRHLSKVEKGHVPSRLYLAVFGRLDNI